MDLYATTAEIKTYLGISGSSKDTLIGVLNSAMTRNLNGLLGVKTLAAHTTTKELTKLYAEEATGDLFVILKAFPLIELTSLYDVDDVEVTDFTAEQRDVPDTRMVHFDGDTISWREWVKVTYKAGYVTSTQSAASGGAFEGEAVTMPEDIKYMIALMVGGGLDMPSHRGRVSSYSLGSKSVTFRSQNEADIFKTLIQAYLPRFKRPVIVS